MGQNGFAAVPLEKRLAVLADIVSQSDEAAVLGWGQLRQAALTAFKQFPPLPGTPSGSADTVRHWLAIQQHLADPALSGWANQQTASPVADIRAAAFRTVFPQHPDGQTALLRRAWSDPDSQIQAWALAGLLHAKAAFGTDDYRRIAGVPEFRSAALRVWGGQGFPGDPSPLFHALYSAVPAASGGGAKEGRHTRPPQQPDRPAGPPHTDIAGLCLNAPAEWQAFCPPVLLAQNTPEHRALALRLLQGTGYPTEVRRAVLGGYGDAFDPDALNVVYALAQAKKDPLHADAVHKHFSFNAGALVEFAKKTANAVSEDPDTRFQAVEFLVRNGQPDALDILHH
jgi:hypothetical protein